MEANVTPGITTFLAEWDEAAGPKIVDTYPAAKKMDLEAITMQIFASFQTVFGNADDVSFDRTNLILPLKSHKVTAKILLDSYRSKQVRGGRLPFIIAFLVPLKFFERELHVYNAVQEKIVDAYVKKKTIDLKEYYPEVVQETEALAMKTRDEAEALLKKKEYWESVEKFRTTVFLLKLTKNASLVEESLKKMENSISKYSKEILGLVNDKIKAGNHVQAERDHQLIVRLAKETKNEKMIDQFTSKLNDFYNKWMKELEHDAKKAAKSKDEAAVKEIEDKIVKIATKAKNEKMLKKHGREEEEQEDEYDASADSDEKE